MTKDILLKLEQGITYPVDSDNDSFDKEDGSVRLAGFQAVAGVQRVTLLAEDWRKDPQQAVGMFPVFVKHGGGMFNLTIPVLHVEEPGPSTERRTFTAIVEVTGEIAPGEEGEYSNEALADDIRDGVFDSIREYAGLNAIITTCSPAPERQKVWVATVSDDNDSPGPAVYVSDTQEGLISVMIEQLGIPHNDDILDWMERNGKVAVWDSYYVEAGKK